MAVRPEAAYTPLQKGICRIRSDMMFEYAFDILADHIKQINGPSCISSRARQPNTRPILI
jgi:hypothetical protein